MTDIEVIRPVDRGVSERDATSGLIRERAFDGEV